MSDPVVVVIGGGISGLASAYRINRMALARGQKLSLLILEKSSRTGGFIKTERRGDFLFEHGPESFSSIKLPLMDLIDELNLRDQLVESTPDGSRTLIAWNQHLHPLPEGFVLFAPTKFSELVNSSLFSLRGKLRMALDLVIPPRHCAWEDESLASFVSRRLGNEALERLAEPLIGGIFSGNPHMLSASSTVPVLHALEQEFGSIIRGLWYKKAKANSRQFTGNSERAVHPRFLSLRQGLQQLVDSLEENLPNQCVKLNTSVSKILPGLHRRWRVVLASGATIDADAVVLAAPASVSSGLIEETDRVLAHHLADIQYADIVAVNVAFERTSIKHSLKASGFVIAKTPHSQLSACTFSSVKFAGRAPADSVMLRLYSKRARALSDDELTTTLLSEVKDYLGLTGTPSFYSAARHLRALPQYLIGHSDRTRSIQTFAERLPGFALAGNAYEGVGLSDCVNSGNLAAEKIAAQLFQN